MFSRVQRMHRFALRSVSLHRVTTASQQPIRLLSTRTPSSHNVPLFTQARVGAFAIFATLGAASAMNFSQETECEEAQNTDQVVSAESDVDATVDEAERMEVTDESTTKTESEVSPVIEAANNSSVTEPKVVYAAVFLDSESREALKKQFPPRYSSQYYDHVTIVYNPDYDEEDAIRDICGKTVSFDVVGVADDFTCQTALVRPIDLEYPVKNKFPHVTLTVNENSLRGDPSYSNVLLERIVSQGFVKDVQTGVWNGVLAEHEQDSTVHEETPARFTFEDKMTLKGTICFSNDWDSEELKCKTVKDCAFCKFMKNGPCSVEYRVWEKCVADCKENDSSFVDECARYTLALKDCIDLNPDYYEVLTSAEENGEEETPADDQTTGEVQSMETQKPDAHQQETTVAAGDEETGKVTSVSEATVSVDEPVSKGEEQAPVSVSVDEPVSKGEEQAPASVSVDESVSKGEEQAPASVSVDEQAAPKVDAESSDE